MPCLIPFACKKYPWLMSLIQEFVEEPTPLGFDSLMFIILNLSMPLPSSTWHVNGLCRPKCSKLQLSQQYCCVRGQHTSPALWKAYGARALELRRRLTLRDVRRMLQGYAAAGIKVPSSKTSKNGQVVQTKFKSDLFGIISQAPINC